MAAVGAAIAAAAAAVVGAVLVFAGGKELAETNLKEAIDTLGPSIGLPDGITAADIESLSPAMWQLVVDERAQQLVVRGGMAVFFALWLLIAGLCARNAATAARVLITIGAVFSLLPHVLIAFDHSPVAVSATSFAAMAIGLVAVVLCWLPANNAYVRARKAARFA
ncbi:hypothetical protein [Amycolatopsis suaedae]|uniref:Uncharacterized protein n=1 Tax=Amycolatopsis suaedae TaxID=2510978 RepID=A0A4Q7J5Y9_9PSEU|nr:hypothetical protein [Amycolatopsis suaedae]RZQ62152.1 hypothetical protein EWH70_21515 [Amycolatopsis suaedae]